jgi:hypothetical protein
MTLTPRRYGELLNRFGGRKHNTKGVGVDADEQARVERLNNLVQHLVGQVIAVRQQTQATATDADTLEQVTRRVVDALRELRPTA